MGQRIILSIIWCCCCCCIVWRCRTVIISMTELNEKLRKLNQQICRWQSDEKMSSKTQAYFCPIMLPLAMELISGLMYGLIACELSLSHVGNCVEPGDITLFVKRFASLSSSVCRKNLFLFICDMIFKFQLPIICVGMISMTYLDARCIYNRYSFPVGIWINRHLFSWRWNQCIQNCPNILIDFESFSQCWFTVKIQTNGKLGWHPI